ncbi:MAG: DUF4234 domain-containing protein [Patescibacteria group bacterium]
MKKRSLGKMFLLFVLTLGIYRLYWLIMTRKEMVSKGQKIPNIWLFLLPYILLVISLGIMIGGSIINEPRPIRTSNLTEDTANNFSICIKDNIYSYAECEKRYPKGKSDYESSFDDTGPLGIIGTILFYVTIFAFLPLAAIFFWPYSKAVALVTRNKISFALAIIAFLAIPDGFDMLIVQDGFNKVAKS